MNFFALNGLRQQAASRFSVAFGFAVGIAFLWAGLTGALGEIPERGRGAVGLALAIQAVTPGLPTWWILLAAGAGIVACYLSVICLSILGAGRPPKE